MVLVGQKVDEGVDVAHARREARITRSFREWRARLGWRRDRS
jgi:hypothetical protein